jgi:hypothetical protein
VVTAVVVLGGYEVVAVTVNGLLGEPLLPSLTASLRRPWLPAVTRGTTVAGRWSAMSVVVGAGVVLGVYARRRALR